MFTLLRTAALATSVFCGTAWAYGGGGSSAGCPKPKFMEPTPGGTASALAEFGFVASKNTDIGSLKVEINGNKAEPAITQRRNGDFEVKVVPLQPITEPGKARITVAGKSREGCSGFRAFYVQIKP